MTTNTERDTQWDFEISRVFHAPVALVFQAWTDMEIMTEWINGNTGDWTMKLVGEFAVGGRVTQTMDGPDGADVHYDGAMEPLEIVPNEKVVMKSWWDDPTGKTETEITTVTLTFEDMGDNTTLLTYHQTFEDENSLGRGDKEFESLFDTFAAYIEPIAKQS